MTSVPLSRRRELVALRTITLNGNPAAISGALQPFARVSDLTTRLSAEWSWEAVERVVERGGAFES